MTHRLELPLASLESTLQIVDRALDVLEREANVFPRFLILLEFHPAVRPECNLLRQPLVHSGESLVDMRDSPSGHFSEVLRNEGRGSQRNRLLLLVGSDPVCLHQVGE